VKIFICGATGVLGRRVVQGLQQAGQQVVGLSRSPENTDWLEKHGADARAGDLFNLEQVCQLSADCQVFLHLATAIPARAGTTREDWAENDRIRREGTRGLVAAALRNHCKLYLQQSITFLYGNQDGAWVDENTPIAARPGGVLQSAVDMEDIVRRAVAEENLPAVTLRFGAFYSYDSGQTRSMFETICAGQYTVPAGGNAYTNCINVDDAAAAVLKIIENQPDGAARTFNICDDEPASQREIVDFVAAQLGAPRPPDLAQPQAGKAGNLPAASYRCKNTLAKQTFGWAPAYPTYREGYVAEIEKWLRT